jgi:CheY-like chemotaxis protein
MPVLDGVETLVRLKENETTACIPVYMLSTTDDRREIERCFQLGCNAYVAKPLGTDALVEAIRRLSSFLQICAVPVAACKVVR